MSKENWSDEKLIEKALNYKTNNYYTNKYRWENVHILRRRPSNKLFLICKALTESENSEKRILGINILAQMGLTKRPYLNETLEIYFNLLDIEKDSYVLMSLLYGIGHNNNELNKTQIEKLCSFSKTTDDLINEGLLHAVGFIKNSKAIDILINFTEHKYSYMRDWATFYLGQSDSNSKKIKEALWKRINDKDENTKFEAIFGLAKRKDERIVEIIIKELKKRDFQNLLFDAILEFKKEKFLPLLQEIYESVKNNPKIDMIWFNDLTDCIDKLRKFVSKEDKNQ